MDAWTCFVDLEQQWGDCRAAPTNETGIQAETSGQPGRTEKTS